MKFLLLMILFHMLPNTTSRSFWHICLHCKLQGAFWELMFLFFLLLRLGNPSRTLVTSKISLTSFHSRIHKIIIKRKIIRYNFHGFSLHCPSALQAVYSGGYFSSFFLLPFYHRRGCSRVLKFCMKPTVTKREKIW